MLTTGVDLAAEDTRTCLATVEWREDAASVVDLQRNVSNAAIEQSARGAVKVGIDCPFGWPVPFLDFITEHDAGVLRAREGRPLDWRRTLANRTTDLFVRERIGLVPLSVSADRIAHAGMRCAALLAELAAAGIAIDRTGQSGKVVEVYPAASLLQWGLAHRGYKRQANASNLGGLVDALGAAAPWLRLGEYEAICRTSDDAFDAVIASLTARAACCEKTFAPTPAQLTVSRREGWIAVPAKDSLGALLLGARPPSPPTPGLTRDQAPARRPP